MTDLTVMARFTFSGVLGSGEPALGLALADIVFWLNEVDRATGAESIIWNGTQNPTIELTDVGAYQRIYANADLDAYNYVATARYNGITVLDQHWINGAVGVDNIPLGTALNWPYQVVEADDTPIEGVKIEIHRTAAGDDVYWVGWTNAFGWALDLYGNAPRLDPSPPDWYFFRKKGGVKFDNPDVETVA